MTVSLLQAVHDAEDVLEVAKLHAEEARKKLQKVLGGAPFSFGLFFLLI
jgi:hypothetical protein